MDILKSPSSNESLESKDQAVETRNSSWKRKKSKSDSKSPSATSDENVSESSMSSGSQSASQITSKNRNDDTGVLLFRRGLIEFLIQKAIKFYENQVKF